MTTNINDMAKFLPKFVTIAKTPDFRWNAGTTYITRETVQLKTKDVISAFMSMQDSAMQEAKKIRDHERRAMAIECIKRMVFFNT